MKPQKKKTFVVVSLMVAGVMVLALAAALLSNFSKLLEVLRGLEKGFLMLALLTTGAAYLSSALSFRTLFKMALHPVPFPKFFSIMFISDTVNFIVSSAGMSSIAIRAFLLKQQKVPYALSIPLSLAQNMVFNLVLSCFSLGGLVYLQGHPEFKGGLKQTALLFFMAGLLLVVACMMMFFFNRAFRRRLFGLFLALGDGLNHVVLAGRFNHPHWEGIQDQVESTLELLRGGWARLLLVFAWVSIDWGCMALTLYFCFQAVGVDLSLGLLLVGFTVMFLSSNVNPVPAGLGISESLLALTFKLLGVDFERTLVAALIYRFVYYLIPLGISTALYVDSIRSFLKSQADEK